MIKNHQYLGLNILFVKLAQKMLYEKAANNRTQRAMFERRNTT
jgi:hypothetical protein